MGVSGRPGSPRRWPALGLLASLWLVLSNFTLVTGGSAALSTVLAAVPFVGLLIGCLVGQPGPNPGFDRPLAISARKPTLSAR